MSDAKPRFDATARQGRREITGWWLFVHEYRRMAASANGAGAWLNSQDKAARLRE
jgi:hypothetical protein